MHQALGKNYKQESKQLIIIYCPNYEVLWERIETSQRKLTSAESVVIYQMKRNRRVGREDFTKKRNNMYQVKTKYGTV